MADQSSEGEWESVDDIPWTLLNLDEFVDAYWSVVAPRLRTAGFDPTHETPTYGWLREQGLRPLLYSLREHHDLTFSQFCRDHLEVDDTSDSYAWSTNHQRSIEALESFLQSRRERKGLTDSSIDTLRYRLDRYVRAYVHENDTDDLVTPVARDNDHPAYEAVDACWSAFDWIHAVLDSGQTKRRIHLTVTNWYAHLVRRKWAAVNPAEGLDEEFDWSDSSGSEDTDAPCLDAHHVRELYDASNDSEERLLVLALCAWGLRPNEVARLHTDQFNLDVPEGDVPFVEFKERKNGPGEVSLLYGMDVLENRIIDGADVEDWNGYLFPSPNASRDHISRWTIWNRFKRLVDSSDVPSEIDGESTTPKMGRRFWYDAYSSSLDVVLESLDEIASEQGSASPEVVLRNYLSESRARDLRREYMRNKLAEAFE